jgi:putative Mn2+ efflux pump MntP
VTLIALASQLGLDSLVVSIPLGLVARNWRERRDFAFALGTCDGLASWLGAHVSVPPAAVPHVPGPASLGCYLLLVFALGWLRRRTSRDATLFLLAAALSFDNFITSLATPDLGVGSALALGLSSTALALAGLAVGALIQGAGHAVERDDHAKVERHAG